MKQEQPRPRKRSPWISMKIEEVGKLTETILSGDPGKCSPTGGDTGENRVQKVKGKCP